MTIIAESGVQVIDEGNGKFRYYPKCNGCGKTDTSNHRGSQTLSGSAMSLGSYKCKCGTKSDMKVKKI